MGDMIILVGSSHLGAAVHHHGDFKSPQDGGVVPLPKG